MQEEEEQNQALREQKWNHAEFKKSTFAFIYTVRVCACVCVSCDELVTWSGLQIQWATETDAGYVAICFFFV